MITFEGLKKAVSEAFANATEKSQMDKLASINKAISDAETETKKLEDDNKELKDAYLDAISHPGTTKNISVQDDPTQEVEQADFADILQKIAKEGK